MKTHFNKNWHVYALAAIMLVAFFVRTWELADTLYFKMDQARDATIAKNTFEEGPGMLPLLGPRAAGTFLRLGPVFYYFQYLSTVFSGSVEPHVMVFPEILLSLLTIPLLFYFLRQFFRRGTSVVVTGLFSLSFLVTQYARFAWNPNQTTFWGLLFLLGIYKPSIAENKNQAGWWLLAAAIGYGVVSQLHFSALLALPLVALAFWIFYRPAKIKNWFWAGAVAIMALFYTPMLLSELITDWDNATQFEYALGAKSKEYPPMEKAEQSLRLHGMYQSLALTSYGNVEDNIFIYFFIIFSALAVWRGVSLWKNEPDKKRRAFLFLVLCLFLVFGLFYTKLAFTVLKPRFWLPTIVIPYVFLSLIFEWLYRTGHKKRGRVFVALICVFLLATNLFAIGYWYDSLANQKEDERFDRKLVLKQNNLVTMKHMKSAADYMVSKSNQTGKQICFHTEGEYRSPYEYILGVYYPEAQFKRISFGKDTNETCTFFSIENNGPRDVPHLPRGHKKEFKGIESREYGVITIWETTRVAASPEKKQEVEVIEEGLLEEILEKEEQQDKRPRRKERVFWKDVFGGTYVD